MEIEQERRVRLAFMTAGLLLQAVIELLAHALQIWEITRMWWWPAAIGWGMVLGGVTFYLRDSSLFTLYLAGLVLAGFPEIPNATQFGLWRYPGDRILFISGHLQVAVAMAFVWGLICPAILAVMKILQRLNLAPRETR